MKSNITYVVYGYDLDYFRLLFNDIKDKNNFVYLGNPVIDNCGNKIIRILYRGFSFLKKVFSFLQKRSPFKIPFKTLDWKVWNKYLVPSIEKNSTQIYFIFFMRWLKPENRKIFELIRDKYPFSKIIVYFEDLYDTGLTSLDYSLLDDYSDLTISYDSNDASLHGFLYFPTFLSKIQDGKNNRKITYDITFVGASKKRYDLICKVYNLLKEEDFKCYFKVFNLQKGQSKIKGIKYIKRMMPYKKYLELVWSSKGILEIMQDGAVGFTLRTWEALLYNKILITNNPAILSAPFYRPEQFIYFKEISDLKRININRCFNPSKHIENLSSYKFLEFITSKLPVSNIYVE